MSRGLRRCGLAAAAGLVMALAAACSSSTTSSSPAANASSPAGATGTLTVFGAGTLSAPFTAELQAFKLQNPGVTIHSQFGASGDMVKDITQLGQPADVLGVADYSLIPKLMSDSSKPHATWYLGFVSNQITFAYTSHSKGASQLSASNWYNVLAGPGVRIGRSNPAADPSGSQPCCRLLDPPRPAGLVPPRNGPCHQTGAPAPEPICVVARSGSPLTLRVPMDRSGVLAKVRIPALRPWITGPLYRIPNGPGFPFGRWFEPARVGLDTDTDAGTGAHVVRLRRPAGLGWGRASGWVCC